MIAALVIALLVGVSSAIPSCSDVQNVLLEDYLQKEKVEATEAVLNNYENKLTFEYLGELSDDSFSAFMVKEENIENLPTLSIGTETFPLWGFAFGRLEKEDVEGAASLSISFSANGDEGDTIFLPLLFAENENEPGFDADLNENLSKLLAVASSSEDNIQDGISIAWLPKLLSNAPVKLTYAKGPESDRTYIADCVVVGKQ